MNEIQYIRDLAKEVYEFAVSPEMNRRRDLWRDHNSLIFSRPPIYIRKVPFYEYEEGINLKSTDPYLRSIEYDLLYKLYLKRIKTDDTITEPYLTVRADVDVHPDGVFGVPAELEEKVGDVLCARCNPSIVEEEDIKKLCVLPYRVNEETTQKKLERLQEVLSGTLDVVVDRQAPLCGMWQNDISTAIAKIRGLEQIMWDAYDRPEWLHELLAYMRDRILEHIDQTEAKGGFRLCNHQNQAMPYCRELEDPSASDKPVSTKQLWGYMAAQEYTTFGPAQFDEFMFRYQKPILERYGLTAYGCCEDLTHKIDVIKTLNNLRRIAVSPFANVKKCAEQIGSDYVLSWRPNPSSACSRGVDEDFVRGELRNVIDICNANKCKWDITLKDLETTSGDTEAVIKWTKVIRDELEKHY